MDYVLGVDGGNTKTDYLLFDTEGGLMRHIRAGTCSHEALPDGFAGARREMGARIGELTEAAGIALSEIKGAAFGLAGVDVPSQKRRLEEIVNDIGLRNIIVMNDSFLGIKAGSESGVGVCSINGTGTVAGGIDGKGNWLQVGGTGQAFGDEAGGGYIAHRAVRAVYDAFYRSGERTSMEQPMLKLFGIEDKRDMLEAGTEKLYSRQIAALDILKLLFEHGNAGDSAAVGVLERAGEQLARSASGCVNELDFEGTVNMVMAGSVWAKGNNPVMRAAFERDLERFTGRKLNYILLNIPPAAGAVLWALELAMESVPAGALRYRVINSVEGLL